MKLVIFIIFSCILLRAEDTIHQQLWTNITLGYPQNDKLYLELDFEPKVPIGGEDDWRNLDITPLIEYYPNSWIDLTAEVVLGYTNNNKLPKSYEVSPRLGIRMHIYNNLRQYIPDDSILSISRFSLATLLRYEYRSIYYDNKNKNTEHQSRMRLRLETKTAFNNISFKTDDTYYLFADAEQYFDFNDDVKERFHNKTRIRLGPGYTYDKNHRFELLMIYDYTKDTTDNNLRQDAVSIDFRYRVLY